MAQSGLKYFRMRARRAALSSVISVTLVLYVLGLFGLVALHAGALSSFVRENLLLQVFLDESATAAPINQLYRDLKAAPFTKSVKYISKEEASGLMKRDLGEDFVSFLDYNPLMASFNVNLRAEYARRDSILPVKARLSVHPIVKEVYYQENALQLLDQHAEQVILLFGGFSLILLLTSFILINQSVKLALFSQRFLIKTMQLVGATKSFIRKPYLLKALMNGFFAGVLAVLLLVATMATAQYRLPELASLQRLEEVAVLLAAVLGAGLLLSWFSTYTAISRYLRYNLEELYS